MYIHDNYCPDKKLLDQLNNKTVWEAMVGRFHWWDGWWIKEPSNIWEHIIKNIWQSQGIEKQIAGFEYWCNILHANKPINHLGWHRDKDEALKARTGEVLCPMVGTIFYGYPHQIEGGFLEIAAEPSFTDVERIRAVYNRVVILDVSQHHRVTKLYQGSRFGLQINLWKQRPETFKSSDIAQA